MLKYQRIVDDVIRQIDNKELKRGKRLPSIRSMAERYSCSKATVIRAFASLESQHLIYAIPQSGFYVSHAPEIQMGTSDLIDFVETGPDARLVPYQSFMHSMNQAINKYSKSLFDYDKPEGLESLRTVLSGFLQEQGVYAGKEELVITSGAQQGLALLLTAIERSLPEGSKRIACEVPTYRALYQMAENSRLELIGIPRDETGLDLKRLEAVFKEVEYFFTVPRLQNPTGASYSEKEKKHLLKLAGKYGVTIIEDDYLSDLELSGSSMPIHFYDTQGKVIYIKSFSKGFMPGIRLGCVVLNGNDALRKELIRLKLAHDFCTPVFTQGALEMFIKNGMYVRHLKKVKSVYREKMTRISAYVLAHKPDTLEYQAARTGIYLWFRLDSAPADLLDRIEKQGAKVLDGSGFYLSGSDRSHGVAMRLSIGALPEELVIRGLEIIFQVVRELER